LLPSQTESFGLAALEAMAWGVPVISSNSGLSEVNLRNFGLPQRCWNTDEMAENALKILKDSTLLKFKENALSVAKSLILKISCLCM
jgi:glycosyltransferase involved in cell wall biosynthesis